MHGGRAHQLASPLPPDRPLADGHLSLFDPHSLIYTLYLDNVAWAYGGESAEYAKLLQRTIEGWRAVGLEPVFVFDGPSPTMKHHTELARAKQLLLPLSLFHLTSPESRSSPSFLHASKILPPLVYAATVDACLALGVEAVWGEGEADELCVKEARARNGWLAGSDSDFIIFSATGAGASGSMKGYVPLDGMFWKWIEQTEDDATPAPTAADDSDPWTGSFQAVKSRRRAPRSAYRNNSPNPPPLPNASFITSLTFTSYESNLLADRLKLPIGLLPLFAALVGNDYHQFQHLFHSKGASGTQKIERVATALREALDPKIAARRAAAQAVKTYQNGRLVYVNQQGTPINGSGAATPTTSGDDAESLLTSVVQSLLLHPVTDVQLGKLIHSLTDSALSYSLADEPSTPLITASSFAPAAPTREEVLAKYEAAIKTGDFAPKLAGVVRDGRYLGRIFLEDTQRGTVGRRVGEPIREMCWSILNDGVGIGYGKEPKVKATEGDEEAAEADVEGDVKEASGEDAEVEDEKALSEDEDENEVVDVKEEAFGSDAEEGEKEGEATPATEEDAEEEDATPVPVVQTYLRSSAMILPKMVVIPEIATVLPESLPLPNADLPVALQTESYRTSLYLALLNSDTPAVKFLRTELKPLALALRWVLKVLSTDADVALGGAKWCLRRAEVEAVLLAGVRSVQAWEHWAESVDDDDAAPTPVARSDDKKVRILELSNRAIHITSHMLHALHELSLLAQTLLLPASVIPPPHRSYSGKAYHTALASETTATDEEREDLDACLAAVIDGESKAWLAPELEMAVDSAQARKDKKKAKKEKKRAGGGVEEVKKSGGGGGGMFAGLDMEEE